MQNGRYESIPIVDRVKPVRQQEHVPRPTGDYNGLRSREIEGVEYARYVNLKSIDRWVELIRDSGFRSIEKLDFEFHSFRAVLCAK